MKSFYTFSRYLLNNDSTRMLKFYPKNNIKIVKYHMKQNNFIYKLDLPKDCFTTDLFSKEKNKILKVDDTNKDLFKQFNRLSEYQHDVQSFLPYRLFYPCHVELYYRFAGIDATIYNKSCEKEVYEQSGIIWNINDLDYDITIYDYIRS